MGFGNFTDVRRYNGAQGPYAHALQHPANRQHPHGRGHHQCGPTDAQETFEQHHAGPATEQAGHEASWQRTKRRADPEHRAEHLRVLTGHRERQLTVDLQHELGMRRPAQYRAGSYRS